MKSKKKTPQGYRLHLRNSLLKQVQFIENVGDGAIYLKTNSSLLNNGSLFLKNRITHTYGTAVCLCEDCVVENINCVFANTVCHKAMQPKKWRENFPAIKIPLLVMA